MERISEGFKSPLPGSPSRGQCEQDGEAEVDRHVGPLGRGLPWGPFAVLSHLLSPSWEQEPTSPSQQQVRTSLPQQAAARLGLALLGCLKTFLGLFDFP